jgi:GNAT superfamily N-acetyltransferase
VDGAAIRPAGPGDAATLARLRYAFRAELGQASEPLEAFLARATPWMAVRLQPGSSWRAWLAEAADGAAAGCAWLQFIEKVPNPGDEEELHGYVTSMYVVPAARGAGVGAALLEAALGACRDAGVDSVLLWPTSRSRPLYGRFGFGQPDDLLELRLGTGRRLP